VFEMLAIRPLTREDKTEWAEFASNSQHATIFHTWEWEEVLRLGCPQETPLYWGIWIDDELVAIWPSSVVFAFGGKILRSLPHSNTGEPIIKQSHDLVLRALTEHVVLITRRDALLRWSAAIPADSPIVHRLASDCDFRAKASEQCTFTLHTGTNVELLWKNLAKNKKHAVKKSTDYGVEVRESDDPQELTSYFGIYKATMLRHNRQGLTHNFFDLLHRFLIREGKAKLFLATDRDEIIAGIIVLLYGEKAYWWSGASLENSWKVYPNDLLLWRAIEWASKSGIRSIDLGPTPSDPASGLNIFKRHFGACRVDFVELALPINPLRNCVITTLVNSYRGLVKYGLVPAMVTEWLQERFWFD